MTRTRFRKFCLAAMAALLAIASSVLVASAGTRAKPPAPKEIKLACIKADGTLAYVTRARQCRGRNKLLRIQPGPVDVCVKHHGTPRGTRAAGDGRRLPAGSIRHTDELGLCGPGSQPNEFPLRLPNTQREWFCVEKGDKTMRWVPRKPRNAKADIPIVPRDLRCRTRGRFPEFPAYVKPGGPFEEPGAGGAPQQPANKAPKGEDDSASTDENTSKPIAVLANDTDADGDALSVESVDTTGTRGDVRVNADGTITWDPAGRFDALAPGDSTNDSFKYKAQDGHGGHTGTTHVDVSVTGVNDAPKVTTSTGSASVTEQGPATAVDGGLGVSDADSPNLTKATVTITAGLEASDELLFTDQNGISGTYDSGTGVLTLTGTASVAHYQTALRSVKFAAGGDDPEATRTIQFRVKDSSAESAAASRTVNVTPVNDAPVNDVPGTQTTDEDTMEVFSDANSNRISVDDADSHSDQLDVEVSVGTGTLTLGNTAVVSSVVGDGTPTVTFSGSRADVNTALDGLTYQPDFNYNGPDTLTIETDDLGHNGTGGAHSDTDTVGITVTAVNDAPINTVPDTQTVNEGGATTVSNGFSVNDVDAGTNPVKTTLSVTHGTITVDPGATLSGNGTGTVELTGSQGDVNTSLQHVKYEPAANDDATRTLTMTTNDQGNSPAPDEEDTDTVDFFIQGVNDAPVVTAPSGTQTIDEDTSKTFTGSEISVADIDAAGNDIKATLTVGHGKLTVGTTMAGLVVTGAGSDNLTLTGTLTEVNDALDGLVYNPTQDYNGNDTLSVGVNDQGSTGTGGALSDSDTVAISVTPVNDAPVVTTSGGAVGHTEGGAATQVDGALTVTDVDDTELASATVTIGSFQTGDTLNFTAPAGITGSYNSGTGVLTFTPTGPATSAPIGDFQTALRSVHFTTSNDDPTTSRTIGFKVNDGDVDSATANRALTITPTNDAPTIDNSTGSAAYSEDDTTGVIVDPAVTVADVDDTHLEGATIDISTGHDAATDELTFSAQNGITVGSWTASTGTLVLTGHATKADYETALESIRFKANGDSPSSATRTVVFQVNDGDADSTTDSRDVTVTPSNDKPVVTTTSGSETHTEGGAATAVDDGVSITDPDGTTTLTGARVKISDGTRQTGDSLSATSVPAGITVAPYDSSSGELVFSGSASISDYETALRSVEFTTSNDDPSTSRSIAFFAHDGTAESDASARGLTITPTNDAPVIGGVSGSFTYTENDPATAIASGLTLTDPDSPNMASATVTIGAGFEPGEDVLSFTAPSGSGISGNYTGGVLTLTGPASRAHFEQALQSVSYSNTSDNPDTGTRTVTFQVDDGASASNLSNTPSRDISVSAVNDAPTVLASAGETEFDEVSAGTPTPVVIDNAVDITDPDSGQLNRVTVAITGGHQASDVLAFTTAHGIEGSYNSGTGVLTLTPELPATTASIGDFQDAAREVTFTTPSTSPGTSRTITFRARDDANAESDDVATARKTITINNVNSAPVITTSGGDQSFVEGSGPVAVDGALTVSDADNDMITGGTVEITGGFQSGEDTLDYPSTLHGISGTVSPDGSKITFSTSGTAAEYQDVLRSVRYDNSSDTPNTDPRTVTFQVTDGVDPSNLATKNVTVSATNDAPVVTATGGNTLYTEQAPSEQVDSGLTVTDADSMTLSFGLVKIAGGFQAGDTLTWTGQVGISATYNGGTGELQLTGSATATAYEDLMKSVRFESSSDSPGPSRSIEFSVDDGAALDHASNVAAKGISITQVNDSPVLTQPDGTLTYTEDDPSENHEAPIVPNLGVADADDANLQGATVTVTNFQSGEDHLHFTSPQNGISGTPSGGSLTLTGSSSVANYQTALRSIRFSNTSETPSTVTRTFNVQVDDGHTGDNPLSNTVMRDIDVVAVNDAPVAADESVSGNNTAHGNTSMVADADNDDLPNPSHPKTTIDFDVLSNDSDVDGPGPVEAMSAGSDVDGTNGQTADGGTVTIEPDGDFTYNPAPSTSCTDSSDEFNYRIRDHGSPEKFDVGKVTVAIAGCVWYVNNNYSGSPDNLGTSNAPFNTLAQAESASASGHTVFVFDGDNTSSGYNTGYAMNSGERLIGEHEGLVVDQDGSGSSFTPDTLYPANPGAHPTLTASNEDVIALDSGNEVRGIQVDPSGTGSGIAGGAGDINGTLDDVKIIDTGTAGSEPGLDLNGTSGGTGYNISNLTVDNSGATAPPSTAKGVALNGAGLVNFASAGTISITTSGAAGLDANTTNMGTGSQFDTISVAGSGSGGVRLFNTTGTTQLGDGTSNDLNLTTTSGTDAALRVSSGGTVSVPGSGTSNISATGGPAVSVDGTPGISLALDDVDSTNSAAGGITLSDMGTGTFSANSGDIGGAAGTAFSVSGGSGTITYPGNLNNGAGASASVTSRTAGTVTLSGQINDNNDVGGGVTVSNNTGGATVLNNAIKTLNTGSLPALVFNGSNAHTLTVENGLNVTTTSGPGVQATGVGVGTRSTLNIPAGGTNPNTITTTTGKALEVSQLDVGAAPLGFQSISSNGASNGIVLNDTGNNNALTVSGTASANPCTNAAQTGCTGGTIQNTTGADSTSSTPPGTGVVLKDTKGVSLTRMRLSNNTNYGIRGTNVNGFTLATSIIHGTNGSSSSSSPDYRDSSMRFDGLSGTASFTDTEARGGFYTNLIVLNSAGTLNGTLSNFTSGPIDFAGGDDGVMIEGLGSSTTNVTVQNSSFTAATGDVFQYIGNGDGGGALNITGSHFSNNDPSIGGAGGGVTLSGGAKSNTTLNVSGSDFKDSVTAAITLAKSRDAADTGNVTGTINSNTIGVAATANSGSSGGSGIDGTNFGRGNMTLDITNNQVHQYNSSGLSFTAGAGLAETGQLNLWFANNTIANPGTNPSVTLFQGIRVNSGVTAGDNFDTCVDFGAGNSIAGSGDPANGGDWRLRANESNIRVPGYGGGANDDAAMTSFVQGKIGSGTGAAVTTAGDGVWAGGAACPRP